MDTFLAIISDPQVAPCGVQQLAPLVGNVIRSLYGERQPYAAYASSHIVFGATFAARASDSVLHADSASALIYVNGPVAYLGTTTLSGDQTPGLEHDNLDPRLRAVWAAARAADDGSALSRLTGSYHALLHDPVRGLSALITDRLASRPIFFGQASGWLCASSDMRCLLRLRMLDHALDVESAIQLVRFQMVLGERTLYRGISSLPPAACLGLDHMQHVLSSKQYWALTRLPLYNTERAAIDATVDCFRAATARMLTGNSRPALLLSGGLDSRMLLACLPDGAGCPPAAYTFGHDDSEETAVTRDVARAGSADWTVIPQVASDYWEALPGILETMNGLYSSFHAHTYRLASFLASRDVDTVIDGWGLDLLHSGSYMPKGSITPLGRTLFTYRLGALGGPQAVFSHLFSSMDQQHGAFASSLLAEHVREMWDDVPRAALRQLLARAQAHSGVPYDWVDDVLFGFGVSRFRSYPVVLGIRVHVRERNPLFESDVLEVYQRLPYRWRYLGPIFRRALLAINPRLARITYFNTGASPLAAPLLQALSMDVGMLRRSLLSQARGALGRLGLKAPAARPYGNYPDNATLARGLADDRPVPTRARRLLLEGPLAQSGLIDVAAVRLAIDACRQRKAAPCESLLVLASLALWLDTSAAV